MLHSGVYTTNLFRRTRIKTPLRASAAYHPYLFAVFAVTSLYAANVHKAQSSDVLLPLAVIVGMTAVVVRLGKLAFGDAGRAGLATSYLLAVTFSYSHAYYLVQRWVSFEIPRRYSLLVYAAAVTLGLLAIYRAKLPTPRATISLNRFSALLVIVSLLTIGASMIKNGHGHVWPESGIENDELIALTRPAECRDIYYLVFDRYASNLTLKEHFNFDNSLFLNELMRRGFHCAANSRTNYPKTVISMSAALNMRYHDERLLGEYHYCEQLRDHQVGRLLRDVGYRYYHFGNWYYPLRSNENADYNFRISRLPSEFADVLYKLTPLGHTDRADLARTWGDPRIPQVKLDAVAKLARTPTSAPKFVYAHFLLPHPPFVFNQDGQLLSRDVLTSRTRSQNYVNQLIYTNQQIVKLVDAIQASSARPPIIVIQADEGPELDEYDRAKSWSAKCRKRTGIISAFCLPGIDARQTISPTITPVNTFRLILREYFGADIGLLPDQCFYWRHPSPFDPVGQTCLDVTSVVTDETQSSAPLAVRYRAAADGSPPGRHDNHTSRGRRRREASMMSK